MIEWLGWIVLCIAAVWLLLLGWFISLLTSWDWSSGSYSRNTTESSLGCGALIIGAALLWAAYRWAPFTIISN